MVTERPAPTVQIDWLHKASSSFYLKEEDYGDIVKESSVLNLEYPPPGVKCEFAHLGFGSRVWNRDLVGVKPKDPEPMLFSSVALKIPKENP